MVVVVVAVVVVMPCIRPSRARPSTRPLYPFAPPALLVTYMLPITSQCHSPLPPGLVWTAALLSRTHSPCILNPVLAYLGLESTTPSLTCTLAPPLS